MENFLAAKIFTAGNLSMIVVGLTALLSALTYLVAKSQSKIYREISRREISGVGEMTARVDEMMSRVEVLVDGKKISIDELSTPLRIAPWELAGEVEENRKEEAARH